MFKALRRLLCRHSCMWSERRQQDICYNCGQLRPVSSGSGGRPVTPDGRPIDAAAAPEDGPI